MTTNSEALMKLTKARAALLLDNPFFGSLACRLKLVESLHMGVNGIQMTTLAVDGKHIYYHPKFINELSLKVLITAVAHEVMHCVWDHLTRRGARNPNKWNHAGDYVINDFLKRYKDKNGLHPFELGEGWLWSARFSGPDWTADAVYSLLPDALSDPGEADGALDHVMDGPPGQQQDASTRAAAENEWRIATTAAANSAKMQGHMTADLERFLDALLKPQVNWVEQLRNFVTQIARNDYNWLRPNKRFSDLYMPSLYNEEMSDIVVVIDDSGSISQQVLSAFGAEIKAIMEDMRPRKVHLIYCDADVKHHYELAADDDLPLKVHGGGGTDFRPPFDFVDKHQIEPTCLVYLTDLQGPMYDTPPHYPVLWVSVSDELNAAWGETIHINPEGLQ